MTANKPDCRRAATLDLDLDWLSYRIFHPPALAECQKATAPALAEYDKARAPALAEYDKARAPALAEYQKAIAIAFYRAALREQIEQKEAQ